VKESLNGLHIIHYPDPRLRQKSAPVTEFDGQLAALVERMYELMEHGRGVGLAASQLGITKRIIVVNATGDPADNQAFINPVVREPHGSDEAEEGCLSLPGIRVQIRRAQTCRLTAQDLQGRSIEREIDDLLARVVQHETDHLNGVLIIDRMGPSDRIATRKTLRALEEQFQSKPAGKL
jgi:peptide deformylase